MWEGATGGVPGSLQPMSGLPAAYVSGRALAHLALSALSWQEQS